jgi:hypothetical protein
VFRRDRYRRLSVADDVDAIPNWRGTCWRSRLLTISRPTIFLLASALAAVAVDIARPSAAARMDSEGGVQLAVRGVRLVVVGHVVSQHVWGVRIGAIGHQRVGIGAGIVLAPIASADINPAVPSALTPRRPISVITNRTRVRTAQATLRSDHWTCLSDTLRAPRVGVSSRAVGPPPGSGGGPKSATARRRVVRATRCPTARRRRRDV